MFWALRLTTDPVAPDAAALEAADGDAAGDPAAEALGPAEPLATGAALDGGGGTKVQPGEAVLTQAAARQARIAKRTGTAAMRTRRTERGERMRADLSRKRVQEPDRLRVDANVEDGRRTLPPGG
jgi:hypothetical protein